MKTSTMITGGTTTLVLGTAAAIPAENAISNDISKFKGKSFEEVYKDGKWKVRFFKTDLAINIFKDQEVTGYEKYYGLNGDAECQVSSGQDGFYWLFEMTQHQFETSVNGMDKNSQAKHLLLVEFNKKRDWFGRSTTYAWFGFNGKLNGNQDIDKKKQKILAALKSNHGVPSAEAFDFLKSQDSETPNNSSHLYVHNRLLLSPLKLNMQKSGNCGKWLIPREHITTI